MMIVLAKIVHVKIIVNNNVNYANVVPKLNSKISKKMIIVVAKIVHVKMIVNNNVNHANVVTKLNNNNC